MAFDIIYYRFFSEDLKSTIPSIPLTSEIPHVNDHSSDETTTQFIIHNRDGLNVDELTDETTTQLIIGKPDGHGKNCRCNMLSNLSYFFIVSAILRIPIYACFQKKG